MTALEWQPALFDLPAPVEEQPCAVYALPVQDNLSEAALQRLVEDLCHWYQLTYHHCRDSRLCDGKGFPDLVIVGPLGTIFRELKVKGRGPAFTQRLWGNMLRATGQDWKIWTERDYFEGVITSELAAISDLAVMGQIPRGLTHRTQDVIWRDAA